MHQEFSVVDRRVMFVTRGKEVCLREGLLPGWRPTFLFEGFAPILILGLEHDNGEQAAWFLDNEMRRLGDTLGQLQPHEASVVRQKAIQVIGALWQGLVCQPTAKIDEHAKSFLLLNGRLRSEILNHCMADMGHDSLYFDLRPFRGVDFDFQSGQCLAKIQSRRLIDILITPMQDQSDNAVLKGALAWPCPFSDELVYTTQSICLNYNLFMYRMVSHGEVFYIVVRCGGWLIPTMIYFPSRRQCFGLGEADTVLQQLFRNPIEQLLLTHVCHFAFDIERYLANPIVHFGLLLRERHIGHHLWNELTEIERLIGLAPVDALPEIILTGHAYYEVYGKIDEIFPEVKGKVNRKIPSDQLIHYVYQTGQCILGPNRLDISAGLAKRVLDLNLMNPNLADDRRLYADLTRDGALPVIVLGLRVENRTIVELVDFWVDLIIFISREVGRALVVFDGYNANSGYEDLVQAEKNVVEQVSARVAGHPVVITDTIGGAMSRSLFWASHAHFFVTLWGAGMAKYCWVCNKPGFAITSCWNLEHRGDLNIYSSGTSEIEFISKKYVDDAPTAPLLVGYTHPHPGGSVMNFHVRTDGVFPSIQRLLRNVVRKASDNC